MKCQLCSNQATIHLTDIIDKKKRETHLCEACARQQEILPQSKMDLQIPALLQYLLGSSTPSKPERENIEEVACPECGQKYAQFRSEGRLGCPHDYDVFRVPLEALLMKIHRSLKHEGKVPHSRRTRRQGEELQRLRDRLQEAVTNEKYEEAALLRDAIRSKERLDEAQ